MKLMIASDLHGSAQYCEELIKAYKRENPEKILLLGDLLYHGPRNSLPDEYEPKSVIGMLNSIRSQILCVRGNCEAEVDQVVLDFPVMAGYCVVYAEGRTIFATHGHNYGPAKLPPLSDGDILLCGHTHVPAFEIITAEDGARIFYANPGSVSIPKENSPRSYLILRDGTFEWKTLDGDIYKSARIDG
ncbi:MAG: phosphodiesterase [Clostridia bacterium]|nr:phosphodiesterase [Clostridia bacterium]